MGRPHHARLSHHLASGSSGKLANYEQLIGGEKELIHPLYSLEQETLHQ
jgi:hypothetical protein